MWKKLLNYFEFLGACRAAAELSRNGYHEAAKQVMLDYK